MQQFQAMLLSVQKTVVDRSIYGKVFIGLQPNGETEAVSSVMQLGIREDKADEVLRHTLDNGIKLGELVNVSVDIVRGGQNSIKQVVTAITSAQRPGQPQPGGQHNKPNEEKK